MIVFLGARTALLFCLAASVAGAASLSVDFSSSRLPAALPSVCGDALLPAPLLFSRCNLRGSAGLSARSSIYDSPRPREAPGIIVHTSSEPSMVASLRQPATATATSVRRWPFPGVRGCLSILPGGQAALQVSGGALDSPWGSGGAPQVQAVHLDLPRIRRLITLIT